MIKKSYRQKTRERARRMAKVRWSKPFESNREERWEEEIHRAKLDRKGQPIATCYAKHEGRVRQLHVRWSVRGSVAQWDALLDGRLVKTSGKRAIIREFPYLSKLLSNFD